MKFVSAKLKVLTLLTVSSLWHDAAANPQNPTVVSGNASFDQSCPSLLQVTADDCAIINWDSFSIDTGEVTKFIQPGNEARVLNRVTSGDPSNIFGTLEANGMLYLINPNGVLVGSNGAVNTASFIASTLDVLDSDFIAKGDLPFSGPSTASVVNMGSIDGWQGDVFLIGLNAVNSGTINTPVGTAGIAAGQNVLLLASGEERLMIQPSAGFFDETGVQSSGQIEAVQVELKADGSLFTLAINHTGDIDAVGVETKDGRVYLVAEGGTAVVDGYLSAVNDNDTGGEIRVLAETIAINDNADIDASADFGGGKIYIGGNIPDTEPVFYKSSHTTVAENADLDASAKGEGDGGTVTIWSSGLNTYAASAYATGGEIGGNGGAVYVGGEGSLEFTGTADTTADFGNTGVLGTGTKNFTIKELASGEPVANIMDTQLLQSNLAKNNCAVVAFTESGDETLLTIEDPVVWSAPHWLYLNSDTDAVVHAGLASLSGSQDASSHVGADRNLTVEAVSGPIDFSFNGSSSLELAALGDLSIQGGSDVGSHISVYARRIDLSGDDVSLLGGSGDDSFVTLNAAESCRFDVAGTLTVQGGEGLNTDVTVPFDASLTVHGNN